MSAKASLRVLQIVLGVVLCAYSVELVIGQLGSGHHGHAFLALLLLGIVEATAAVVFLFAAKAGGPALLATFAVAAVFHALHGEAAHIGVLAIYAAAVLAVMSSKRA